MKHYVSMEVIETEKGKPALLYGGHAYRKKRTNADGAVTWVCLQERTKNCRGRLVSRNMEILNVSDHECIPDIAKLDVMKSVFKAKKRVREECVAVAKVYSDELGTLHDKGYEFVTALPRASSVKRTLHRHKYQAQGSLAEPTERQDVELSEQGLKMSDGSNFLLADNGREDRIIAFAGDKGRECLKTQRHFFMDGTFRSCSKQFAQIYTIHADIGSNEKETNVIPVLFALLPNKKKETYIRLFRLVMERIPEWNPQTINVDFESAAISALQEVFPSVDINGCFFHMKKCLWRKVQSIGLTNEYRENEEVRLSIRMCAALAFLKPEDICEGWLIIHGEAPSNSKLEEFFDYFIDQWLENEAIPVQLWTCYKRRHRTNNAVEGWNNKINVCIGKPHPKIQDVIACLKSEAENTNIMYMRMELHLEGKKRKKLYVNIDEKIRRSYEMYEHTGDLKKHLKTIAYVQNLD